MTEFIKEPNFKLIRDEVVLKIWNENRKQHKIPIGDILLSDSFVIVYLIFKNL